MGIWIKENSNRNFCIYINHSYPSEETQQLKLPVLVKPDKCQGKDDNING